MGLVQNTAPPLAQREAGSRQAYSYKLKVKGSILGGTKHMYCNGLTVIYSFSKETHLQNYNLYIYVHAIYSCILKYYFIIII